MKRAPRHLSKEAKQWFKKLQIEYSIYDKGGLLILQSAMEAFDRMKECQEQIAREGATFLDRFAQIKPHPLLSVERDARSSMLNHLKSLNLDLEPLHDGPGNPGKYNKKE